MCKYNCGKPGGFAPLKLLTEQVSSNDLLCTEIKDYLRELAPHVEKRQAAKLLRAAAEEIELILYNFEKLIEAVEWAGGSNQRVDICSNHGGVGFMSDCIMCQIIKDFKLNHRSA